MGQHFILPDAPVLRRHLEMLFGDGLAIHPAERLSADASFCGAYRDDSETPVGVCLCDSAFGAYAGAALSMLMPADAVAAASSGAHSDLMRANLYEVMNILSSLLMRDSAGHLRLREMSTPATIDPAVKALAAAPSNHASFKIDIARYGSGRLSLAIK